ncbi:hypothetical protein CA54_18570 [Symmachiella macrocystis]|uniref:Uncharacterized protein n=1 Tax=Symmachiella macrocystis TaxID=2527985 RepID=A0A5C6BNL4_9PLAN|nr:hypothetical protein [Symmachiella macrocystis]TWU13031.1 hypothetical protein CA54_18570 [Symmachiella macrocystis]
MSDKPSTSLVVPSTIAIVMVIYGYVTFTPELKTARPPASETAGFPAPPSLEGIDAVDARLWEDPLSVIYETQQKPDPCAQADPSCENSVELLRKYLRDAIEEEFSSKIWDALAKQNCEGPAKSVANLVVLPVLLPGDRYGDDRERRMRIRYSVVSGLSLSDYRPKLHKRISYVCLPIQVDSLGAAKTKKVEIKIPIELYVGNLANGVFEDNKPTETTCPDVVEASGGCTCSSGRNLCDRESMTIPKTPVLVCWIDERQLGIRPLATIAQILDQSLSSEPKEKIDNPIHAHVRILGPSTSDVLLDMAYENDNPHCFNKNPTAQNTTELDESGKAKSLPCGYLGKQEYLVDNVRIYSPMATIAHQYLRNTDPPNTEGALTTFTNGTETASGVIVFRTIGTDVQLAKAVKHELQLRDAWPPDGAKVNDCHVVLIAERDTQYGRAIIDNYNSILGFNQGGSMSLTTVAYLRGLDGETHNQKANSEALKEKNRHELDHGGRPVYDMIEPEGKSQYDYLDRLKRHLTEVDQQLRDNGKRGITAIGVVGSDMFDKLLILRAIRKNFPNSQFFTTDLDANFWRKTEYPTTRNIIVASHFGLMLHSDLQRDVPPFRNSYQTSFFLATLLATDDRRAVGLLTAPNFPAARFVGAPRHLWEPGGTFEPLQPLLFEIGRHGPYQLTTTGGDISPAAKNKEQWNKIFSRWKENPEGSLSAKFHPPSPRESLTLGQLFNKSAKLVASAALLTILVAIVVPPKLNVRKDIAQAARHLLNGFNRLWASGVIGVLIHFGIHLPLRPTPETASAADEKASRSIWTYMGIAILILIAVIGVVLLITHQHRDADGEPFALFEGISIWPSTILLALSASTSGYLLRCSYQDLKQNEASLRTNLEADLTKSFQEFQFDSMPTFHALRSSLVISAILSVLFFGAILLLLGSKSWPFLPFRGPVSGWVAWLCLLAAYAMLIWLTQFVLIHVRSCRKTIKEIDKLQRTGDNAAGFRKLIELVARRTDEVGKTLQYPFFILLVMYIAQLGTFDNWRINVPIIILWAVLLVTLFWAALYMRRDAQTVRRKFVRILTDYQADPPTGVSNSKTNYKDIIAALNNEDRGAYRSWTEDYLLRALAIPLSGSGGLLLLQQWILN